MFPHRAALYEAFEEAGVLGLIERVPVGEYSQRKVMRDGSWVDLMVAAFPLLVNTELLSWPEMSARRRRWMPVSEAINTAKDGGIRAILMSFARHVAFEAGCQK